VDLKELYPEDREYISQLGQDVNTFQYQLSPAYARSTAIKLQQIEYRAPWLSPEVQLALAKSGASTAAIDRVGEMAAQRELDSFDQKKAAVGEIGMAQHIYDAAGWIKKGVSKTLQNVGLRAVEVPIDVVQGAGRAIGQVSMPWIKAASRWSLGTLMGVPEMANTVLGQTFTGKGLNIPNALQATTLATMLEERDLVGEGFLPGRGIVEEQAARSRAVRGTVYGSAFTLGRGVMSVGGIFRKEDVAYRYGSGLIDTLFNLFLPEPSKYIVKGAKLGAYGIAAVRTGENIEELRNAGGVIAGMKGLVPLLSDADAKSLVKALGKGRQKYLRESGVEMNLNGATYNAQKFDKFWRTNPYAKKMVRALIDNENPAEIFEDVFNFKITTDQAMRIAKAKTEDEMIQAFAAPWTFGERTLKAAIGEYKFERNFVGNSIRKMRLFKEVPGSEVIIRGGDEENAQAVKNMVLSLRAGGATKEEIHAVLNGTEGQVGLLAAFSNAPLATPTAKRRAINAYKSYLRTFMRSAGVRDNEIDQVLKGGELWIDQVQTWFRNRTGVETDNGLLQVMFENFKENLPQDLFNEMFEGAGVTFTDVKFTSPAQLSDLLSRGQILPDVREIRRLTRNSLFRKLLESPTTGKQIIPKLGITSRSPIRRVDVVSRENLGKFQELQSELSTLERLKGQARLNANDRIDDIKDEMRTLQKSVLRPVLTGQQRYTFAAVELLQQRIWKMATLATGGYALRNMMDAQVRMASGGVNQFYHPIDYINTIMGVRLGKSIRGVDFTDLGERAGRLAREEGRELAAAGVRPRAWEEVSPDKVHEALREAFGQGRLRPGFTAGDATVHTRKTNSFVQVDRASGPKNQPTRYHTDGVIQAAQKRLTETIDNRVAMALSAGVPEEQIVDEVIKFLDNPRTDTFRRLQGLFAGGLEYVDNATGVIHTFPPFSLLDLKSASPEAYTQILQTYVRHVVIDGIKYDTGNLDEVLFLFAHNAVGDLKNAQIISASEIKLKPRQKLAIGQTHTVEIDGKEIKGIVQRVDGEAVTFVPVLQENAATGGFGGNGQKLARRLIEAQDLWNEDAGRGLARTYAREQRMSVRANTKLDSLDQAAVAGMDFLTGWWFNFYDTASRKLEKSVVFRQFYYDEVVKHINKLSYEEGMKLYADIYEKSGGNIAKYFGESKLRNKVTKAVENLPARKGIKGTLTVEELDDYARFVGIEETKGLLYNATYRNNFWDAMRIVAPFEGAWRDVIGRYKSLLIEDNIHAYRQFHKVYRGVAEADPDQDGRGFIYQDPTTGEQMFTFPMSGTIAKLFTGINAPLAAPLTRLSQGISFFPALGPWASFSLSKILPDVPRYDQIKTLLLPYGEVSLAEAATPVPSWMQKMIPVVEGALFNRVRMNTTYGNTYMETLRALSVNTVKYDLSTEEGVTQIMADAKRLAGTLTAMRALGQFTGPASPTTQFKVPTKQGDKFINELQKELRQFESEDYDSAVDRFLKLYGDDLMLYVSSKSRAVAQGLEATYDFGVWERENQDLINQYPDTAYFMAPRGGGDFDFTVWQRQLQEGARKTLTDREMIELAQQRVGSVKYRAARRMFGPNPNQRQIESLRAYREFLNNKLPGFPKRAQFEANKLTNDIDQMYRLVEDPRLKDNKVAAMVRDYLASRRSLMRSDDLVSFQSKKATRARTQLYRYGEALAARNPEFDRVWQRFLVQEVDI